MKLALSKAWLPAGLQHDIWLWAHDTPHACVMRGVTVITWPLLRGVVGAIPLKISQLKSGVCQYAPLGYVCVNPCYQCEIAENTGIDHFCGECRLRPMVYTTDITNPFPGGYTRTCGDYSPRRAYLRRHGIWDDSDEEW